MSFYWDNHQCPRCKRMGHRFMDCPVEEQFLPEPIKENMTTKITIEVPAQWGDVKLGSPAAASMAEKVKELVLEQRPSKYEQWKDETTVMKSLGYLDTLQRRLAQGAPALVEALVISRTVLARIVDEQTEAVVRIIDDTLKECMPKDVVEEIRAANPIRGQVTEFSD